MQISSYIFQTPYSQPLQVGRPDPSMIKEQNDQLQNEANKQQQNTAQLLDTQSKQDQAQIAVKSSTAYQNDKSYASTERSLKDYAEVSKEAQRTQNINAYANSGEWSSRIARYNFITDSGLNVY